ARLGPPVFGATLFRSVCCGPVFLKSCCALGCVESCRWRSRDAARVARREDVVEEVSTVGTGQDLAGSEIRNEKGEVIKWFKEWRGKTGAKDSRVMDAETSHSVKPFIP
ncbi:hypothetical protein F5888DRAFT_1681435, partial [Russula emetica]